MTIRNRLIFSYIAMIFIPLILFIGIASLLGGYFLKDIAGNNDLVDSARSGGKTSPIWETFEKRKQLMASVKLMAHYEPDRLMDPVFLKEMNEQFDLLQAGLVIIKDDHVIYASPLVDGTNLSNQLKHYETNQDNRWRKKWNNRFTVEQYDFAFSNQSFGTIYLLSDVNPLFERVWKFFPILFLSLLVVIAFTNGLLTFLVSRSIIKPLYQLKSAAEQIKEGNLDSSLSLRRKDEIGEVGEAFEEMRERLKRSIQLQLRYEENRKELVSNISHDLKTPITGIKACIEGIRDGIADTEEKKEKYMQMMDKKVSDMDHLIDELFLFSKLDLNRLPFQFENIDLVAYLRDCSLDLQVDPQLKGVKICFKGDIAEPLFVMADREKLQRVLMNIVSNSLKYMNGKDKDIQLTLIREERDVRISIQDNGSGIESNALPYIFDRFFRADPSRNTLSGGSGLGLAIVKQIVEEHGGRISADSTVGEGTTISFTLPLQKQEVLGGEKKYEENSNH
ncbi:ATP-binding protein [Peribacillus loiseleuriae]|uniref:sensor histidine kinase n=1 Tax=Peribacillus loiseleuriae TaxID=1679170 RepID=UPI003CFC0583